MGQVAQLGPVQRLRQVQLQPIFELPVTVDAWSLPEQFDKVHFL